MPLLQTLAKLVAVEAELAGVEKQQRQKRRLQLWILLALAGVTGAMGVRSLVVTSVFTQTISAVAALDRGLPAQQSSRPDDRIGQPHIAGTAPTQQDSSLSDDKESPEVFKQTIVRQAGHSQVRHGGTKRAGRSQSLKPPLPLGPDPKNTYASADLVLAWAEARLVPEGIPRSAGDGLPAGLELRGASGLGVGILDGDRLLAVDGTAVQHKGQVIQAVLAARASGRQSMQASLVRRTMRGPQTFSITVEQPYLP